VTDHLHELKDRRLAALALEVEASTHEIERLRASNTALRARLAAAREAWGEFADDCGGSDHVMRLDAALAEEETNDR
jgi:hypothetical protein